MVVCPNKWNFTKIEKLFQYRLKSILNILQGNHNKNAGDKHRNVVITIFGKKFKFWYFCRIEKTKTQGDFYNFVFRQNSKTRKSSKKHPNIKYLKIGGFIKYSLRLYQKKCPNNRQKHRISGR